MRGRAKTLLEHLQEQSFRLNRHARLLPAGWLERLTAEAKRMADARPKAATRPRTNLDAKHPTESER